MHTALSGDTRRVPPPPLLLLCCLLSSAVSEQQQAQHQQAGRSTCQAGIRGILLGLFVVASHIGHVLEALVLVWDFVSVAHNPAQARVDNGMLL